MQCYYLHLTDVFELRIVRYVDFSLFFETRQLAVTDSGVSAVLSARASAFAFNNTKLWQTRAFALILIVIKLLRLVYVPYLNEYTSYIYIINCASCFRMKVRFSDPFLASHRINQRQRVDKECKHIHVLGLVKCLAFKFSPLTSMSRV